MTRDAELDMRDVAECDHVPETPVSDGISGTILYWLCRCGRAWTDQSEEREQIKR